MTDVEDDPGCPVCGRSNRFHDVDCFPADIKRHLANRGQVVNITPREKLLELAAQPFPASDWEKKLAQELLEYRAASKNPSDPTNRHVTLDERTIFFPMMSPVEFDLKAVPHCLSKICRYNGFINRFYSVAQHSVMTCELAEAVHGKGSMTARCALLHDAAEAYLGDVSRPLKICLPDYRRIEHHVESVIRPMMGLPNDPEIWREVGRFDEMALYIEANELLFHKYPWVKEPDNLRFCSPMAKALAGGYEMLPDRAKLEMTLKMQEYGMLRETLQ